MAATLRRIVSGPKARFVADGVDLDLSYITDRLIIMAFPAAGIQTMWRNDRRSVRKFLDSRHGRNWRVYNFCPKSENEYDDEEFYGRVSRYPFPDHHAPPLSLIPMAVADMTAWLAEDPRNVVVIHCKAGKGRSGTMACCYLVSLPKLPSPPLDARNHGGERAMERSQSHASSSNCDFLSADSSGSREERRAEDEQGSEEKARSTLYSRSRKPSIPFRAHRSMSALRATSRKDSVQPPLPTAVSDENRPCQNNTNSVGPCSSPEDIDPTRRKGSRAVGNGSPRPHPSGSPESDPFFEASDSFGLGTTRQPLAASTLLGNQLASIEDKLEAVFDLHTSRRLKPQKPKSRDKRSIYPSMSGDSSRNSSRFSLASPRSTLPFAASSPHLPMHNPRTAETSPTKQQSATDEPPPLPARSMGSLDNTATPAADCEQSPSNSPVRRRPSRLSFALPTSPRQTSNVPGGDKSGSQHLNVPPTPGSFRALGIHPTGRSTDNLLAKNANFAASAEILSTPNVGDSAARDSSAPAPAWPDKWNSTRNVSTTRNASSNRATWYSESTEAFSLGDESEIRETPKTKKFGVSISSQRRWVGYWTRMLSNADSRTTVNHMAAPGPQRKIRLVRISVLQEAPGQETREASSPKSRAKAMAKLDSFRVYLGRYDDELVDKLESWERGARRRARAFGVNDPGARSPELTCFPRSGNLRDPPRAVPGEQGWSKKSRSLRPSTADWQRCVEFNSAESAKKRLAQHGNEEGVGQWGVDVVSEAERVRHFNWPDGSLFKQDNEYPRHFDFINWFKKLKRSERLLADFDTGLWHHFPCGASSNPTAKDNSAATTAAGTNGSSDPVRRDVLAEGEGFILSPDREVCIKIHLANKTLNILPDIAGAVGWVWFIPAFEDPVSQRPASGTDSPARSGTKSSLEVPQPSVSSGSGSASENEQNSGDVYNSQRRQQTSKAGMRTTVRFNRDEIDFAKKISGLKAIEVEWEWVDMGRDADGDDDGNDDGEDGIQARPNHGARVSAEPPRL